MVYFMLSSRCENDLLSAFSYLRASYLLSHMGSLIDWLISFAAQYLSAHLEGDVIKFPAVAQRRSAGINQSRRGSGGGGQTFPRPPAVSPAARRTFGALGAHFTSHRLLPWHGHLFSCGWVEHFCLLNTFPPVEFRVKATEVQSRLANITARKRA